MPPARKYLPLNRYLEDLSSDQQTIQLTFRQLEEILGAALPPSAWLAHYWAGSTVARYNWERSGFAAKLDRLDRLVEFKRRPSRRTATSSPS
ncbi:MAG TPA: hypothetical protein VKV26_05520 [Dehalococcoidia bacterium]|nr:hypothetical protein [Dehalococcoidia bacterium]